VDIAKDALQAKTQFRWPVPFDLPGYHPVTRPHSRQVREAARMMMAAQRPVLYVGGGVIKAGASEDLVALAELTGMPVVTTLMARGAFPSSHPQNLGMPGMHGKVAAVGALQKADLLVALGARFDDRVTGRLDSFAPEAAVVHADIDPAEISKNRHAEVPIVGDCREVIIELLGAIRAERETGHQADLSAGGRNWTPGGPPTPATTSPVTARFRRSTRSSGSASWPGRTRTTWRVGGTRCGRPSSSSMSAPALAQLRRPRHDGLRGAAPWGPKWARRSRPCGRSTATAASR
jgi:thiamine pyrophosphate-dependent acetolactate synthase large subunit-like protein